MRIFIIKPSSLGDVIQALPVLRLLKLDCPAREVFWWIDSNLAPLLEGDPDLTGVIPFDRARWGSPWHWHEAVRSLQTIRSLAFDWVIDLQSLLRSAAVAWLANGQRTIGLDDPREGAPGFYDLAVRRPTPQTHAVDWYLGVLPPLGVPVHHQFTWLPPRPEIAQQVHERWNPGAARWIVLQPGARWDNKRWPIANFATVVAQLASCIDDVRFVILGGNADRELGAAIANASPSRCLDLTGRTSLPQMIEWIRLCAGMVTNDTGPMHAAAALGKPVAALFGPTDPRRTGPYGQLEQVLQHSLPCVPCMKDVCRWSRPVECLHALLPQQVIQRARSWLDAPAEPPRPISSNAPLSSQACEISRLD